MSKPKMIMRRAELGRRIEPGHWTHNFRAFISTKPPLVSGLVAFQRISLQELTADKAAKYPFKRALELVSQKCHFRAQSSDFGFKYKVGSRWRPVQ
jgi:hypothetical protein